MKLARKYSGQKKCLRAEPGFTRWKKRRGESVMAIILFFYFYSVCTLPKRSASVVKNVGSPVPLRQEVREHLKNNLVFFIGLVPLRITPSP